jgi:Zn-dependent M28 family amino/carboxypeptidase
MGVRLFRAVFGLGTLGALVIVGSLYRIGMLGKPDKHVSISLTLQELKTRDRLRKHVEMLAGTIRGRNAVRYRELSEAVHYIEEQLRQCGYNPLRQTYTANSQTFTNIEAELSGTQNSGSTIVIGAHYDTAGGLPGANDNASGVAAVLELARQFAGRAQVRSIRWVLFANEEPPYFQTPAMGSYVYAKRCHERKEEITAMLSIETIGYYSEKPGTQSYPVGLHPGYPDRGDFLGFVADIRSSLLLRRALKAFRNGTSLPAQGAAAPASIPGIGWSDHWSFWQFGYRALMVTDTAPYRYPYYHSAEDTPEKLDYDRMACAVTGLAAVIRELASP